MTHPHPTYPNVDTRRIAYLQQGIYRDLDIPATLDYMARRYVDPIAERFPLAEITLADCAAGFGWLSFAFLLEGGKRAILIEPDGQRLAASRELAQAMGIAERCEFIQARLQEVDLADDAVDVFASIETLEHVGAGNIRPAVANIARIARRAVVLTTPNLWFPAVAHDTRLPFAHWLPPTWRRPYAAVCRRTHQDEGNTFVSPLDLAPLRKKFRPDSPYQTFSRYQDFLEFYPHYLPYGEGNRLRAAPPRPLRWLVRLAAGLLGRHAYLATHTLAAVWVRKQSG